MDNLTTKYNKTLEALATLEEAIDNLKKISPISLKSGEPFTLIEKIFHDSLIQRFEYTFDSTWKYMLLFLEKISGLTLDLKAPKPIFRTCLKTGLLNEKNTELAIKMVDHRNSTTHHYDAAMAREIVQAIPSYYALLKGLLEKAKPTV